MSGEILGVWCVDDSFHLQVSSTEAFAADYMAAVGYTVKHEGTFLAF
jgi:hypothetical protein